MVLVLLLGACGGLAYWRGLTADIPGVDLDRGGSDEPRLDTVTVYGALCPADYAGDDYFGDCYDTPAAAARYTLTVGETRVPAAGAVVAGGDGFATLTFLSDAATGGAVLEATAPEEAVGGGWFEAPAAACTAADGRAVAVADSGAGADGLRFAFAPAGGDLRCDVYFVPVAPVDGTAD